MRVETPARDGRHRPTAPQRWLVQAPSYSLTLAAMRPCERTGMTDGYNTTITLDCGDSFRLNIQPDDQPWKVGWWAHCAEHSQVAGYDPVTGDPEFARDRQVTAVTKDPS